MYNPDTELLFPPRLISQLHDQRGEAWHKLVDSVSKKEATSPERVAFVLLMVRLHGCATCQADSYRAIQGCTQCSLQTLKRLRGTDDELIDQYNEAHSEVLYFLEHC